MEWITLTAENLEQEHICCAISNNRDPQVAAKKAWLSDRMAEGLVFRKGDVRGKCFIEYLPAEAAWAPVDAAGYLYLNCLWVSGQYKGQGYSGQLLDSCIEDAKRQGKRGIVALSSSKKRPFLSDPKFLRYKGFVLADTAAPDLELLVLPLQDGAPMPSFKPCAKKGADGSVGWVLYYTAQCPYTAKYVPLLEAAAKEHGVLFRTVQFKTGEEAQASPSPCTTYSLFYQGQFVTNEILSVPKFEKLLKSVVN